LGSAWGDYDNDGDLDLFLPNFDSLVSSVLYANNGDGTFTKITTGNIVNDEGVGTDASWGDYDNDGDLDLFVANWDQNNFLYVNNGNQNNWINLKLVGIQSNSSGIGSKVRLKATIFGNSYWQMREISGESGRGGQNTLHAEFGLGDATVIDSAIIEWPSDIIDIITNVSVNQFIVITEGAFSPVSGLEDNLFSIQIILYPNPTNRTFELLIKSGYIGNVNIRVVDQLGRIFTSDNIYKGSEEFIHIIDLSTRSSGIYFILIQTKDAQNVRRIIKY